MFSFRNYYKTLILFFIFSATFIYPSVDSSFSSEGKDLSWPEKRRRIASERVLTESLYGRTDPFAALVQSKLITGERELKLDGIMWTEENPRAIINSIIVEAGDTISGKKVIKITKAEVILEKDGEQSTLRMSYDMGK